MIIKLRNYDISHILMEDYCDDIGGNITCCCRS